MNELRLWLRPNARVRGSGCRWGRVGRMLFASERICGGCIPSAYGLQQHRAAVTEGLCLGVCPHVGWPLSDIRVRPGQIPGQSPFWEVPRSSERGTASRHQRTTQGGGCALGSHMPTVGEDYLPLHEMSTNSKRTTCLPPHMVCEVHHTKSGYEQLESRNSHCRPTRS